MLETLEKRFRAAMPAGVDFCSMRYCREKDQTVSVRQDVPEPVASCEDSGVMITVVVGSGLGYAATCDLSPSGLTRAADRAARWAGSTGGRGVVDFSKIVWPHGRGQHVGPEQVPWDSVSLAEKLDRLIEQSRRLKTDERIVDWEASLWHTGAETLYLTADGGRVHQRFSYVAPQLRATANKGVLTQTRTLGGHAMCRQGGMEVLDQIGFEQAAPTIAAEALELLAAENCPTGEMDLLLAPDQMVLQIHESIGHPLELDRILGDERNYAGASFLTPEMIGTYRYGSDLLNVTFDPTAAEQLATYGYDDEGLKARKEFIVRNGTLVRALGGTISQARSGLPGVANSRGCGWNRPPIDRMANLNLEPGDSSLEDMTRAVGRGVHMKTNCSWSIDDSRNKFQFGCEWGRMIENGEWTRVVRNPNYRGVSATFWRNLKAVGQGQDVRIMGTPYCGKGEPNQCVRVGHASPPCLFENVEVFGGV